MASAAKHQHGKFQKKVEGFGFDVVHPGADELAKSPIKFEIVAIPGIGEDDVWSWNANKTNWLRDTTMLSRKIPDARISIFNYSAEWFDKGSVNQRLGNMAERLLLGLDRMREINNTKTAIIFVCHSMGGIILEKALLMSRARQDEFPSVYPYVAGSIFLGTPFHALTEPRAQVLAKMAESLIGIGTSSEIVEFLAKDVQSLRNLHDDFAVLAGEAQLRLYCFFEQKDIERVRFSIKGIPKASYKSQDFIVDAYSARHSSANTLGLAADHFRLNKYETPKDPNFTFVSEEIRSIVRKADGILRSRQNAQIKALVDERTYRRMVNHLVKGFQDFDSAINGQHKGSQGSELLEQAAFTEWRQQDTNKLLWVHGKAGTGQGAVASAAIESLKPTGEDGSVVVSFYCDQSEKLRRSLLGLLQLVVYQVIENNRDLAVHLLSDSKKAKEVGKQEFNPEATLREQVLWDALQSMAKYLPNRTIYIIVYGLEQLSEDALDDFLLYMKLISDASPLMDEVYDVAPIKWLLLSRSNRPSIRACLRPRALEIDLEVKENAALISNNLRFQISRSVDDLQLPSSLAYFVKRHVHSRSEDNEIYIKLVIQEVRNAWIPGKTPHADIRKLLESFPYGLTNLFDHICKRVLNPKAEGFEYTKEILRCRICAHVSPTMRDLAIMAGLPEDDRENLEKLKTYVLRCGAFLTLRGDKWDLRNNTVEWINISAQEYLQQYARAMLGLDLLDMQNGIIALRCLEYIYEVFDRPIFGDEQLRGPENVSTQDGDKHMDYSKEDGANFARSDSKDTRVYEKSNNAHADDDSSTDGGSDVKREEGGIDSNRDRDTGTVLTRNTEYPMRYWVKHAQRAPRDMLDELDLNLPFWQDESEARQRWWQLIPDVQSSDQQDGVSALHMAVVLKFPALVEYLLERGRGNDTHKDDSLGFQPLYYACRGGDEDIVNALLGAEADINYTSDSNQPAALHAAASNWHRKIVETLLERDADLDATSPDHGTALYAAISNHDHEITKLLLSRGAKVNTIGGAARRALNVGALVGNLEGVRALVDLGADVDPDEDYWYGSAVGAASRNGHADVVEYLLSRGWDSSRAMKTYGSFLVAAATYKHLGVVEILLKKEERVFVLESALLVASKRGYVAILEAILGKRPALNLQRAFSQAAYYGRTEVLEALFKNDLEGELRRDKQILDAALYQATDNEHEETVKLLLEHGADPNTTGPTYGFALEASAYDGTTNIMRALIEKGADVNKRGGEYGTALQGSRPMLIAAAAFRGEVKNVELLLDHGALLNTAPIGYYGNELQAAVYTGNEETIRLLIQRHADVNAYGGHWSFAIITAVSQGYSDATRILLEHNAHVNVRGGEDNWPVISLAGANMQLEDLKLIMKNVVDINATCEKGTTALINCAAAGDDEGIEFLLANGADVHIISSSVGSALHAAAAMGSKTCCEILLKAGADVNAVGGEFGTAIQAAIYARRLKIVRLLLEAGADVLSESTISGFYGTALQAAAAADSLRIVRELLKNGALPNTSKASGEFGCALQVAAIAPKPDIAKLLLEHGANVNFTGGYHHLPIMAAAQFPRPSNLRLLLEHGADATATGGIWGSTIIAAVYGNDLECIETLISRGADVRATGGLYGCALQAAAVKADMKIIEYILDCAIDLVNHRDGKYYTPLIAAAYFDRLDVVTKLLDSGADFRHRGGQYRSVITAAAIRGNKSILEKFLGMGPDEVLLDEALVEAVAHRQSASVDLLLRSRANVFTRHPTLGTPAEALQAPEILEVNPDDEEDLKEKDGGDDDDEEKDDNDDEQWQGDDGASISGETDTGSVMDLQLEEELTETTKIQKLLAEAEARHKRNPTMKRFKSVKVRGLPQRSGRCVMPPPVPQLPSTITYAQFQPPNGSENRDPRYKQHSQTSRITPSHSESGHERAIATIAQPGYPSSFNQSQTAHPVQILARRLVQSPSDSSQHGQSLQNPQQGQYPFPASQRERQYSTGSTPQQTRSYTPPSRKGSDDPGLKRNSKVVNRRSVANLGLVGRYQHRQSSQPTLQGSTDQLVGLQELDGSSENTTFPTSTPQPARHNTYPHQQQQFLSLPPTQLQQFDQPPQWQQSNQAQQVQIFSQPLQGQFQAHPLANHPRHTSPPPQEPGQMLHNRLSQTSSPASFQSNQYANSTPRDSQISTWDTPPSVQGEFRAPDDAHRRKWGTGGYDGDGYGG